MNVLILGGTRFFGRELQEFFSLKGNFVGVFSRRTPVTNVEYYSGDRSKEADLKKVADAKAWDIVIDNIGFEPDQVELSLKVFKNLKRYIFTSSISTYRYSSKPANSIFSEEDVNHDFHPPGEDLKDHHWKYASGKKECEKVLLRSKDFPYTIFRLSMVVGPNEPYGRLAWYLEEIKKKNLLPTGENKFQLLYSKDIPPVYEWCTREPNANRQIFNLTNPHLYSVSDTVEILCKKLKISIQVDNSLKERGPLFYDRDWIIDIKKLQTLTPLKISDPFTDIV